MLLSQAERTRLGVFALGRLRVRIAREAPQSAEAALLKSYLEVAARVPLQPAQAMARMLKDAGRQMGAITGQLRTAMDLAASASVAGLTDYVRQELRRPVPLRLAGTLATLRANVSLRYRPWPHRSPVGRRGGTRRMAGALHSRKMP